MAPIGANSGYGDYVPDNLIAGSEVNILGKGITLLSGTNYPRGSVVGKISRALGDITPKVGNTGNGTLTGAALATLSSVGDYLVTCTAAATNGGTFSVQAPDGSRLADAKVGTAYVTDHLHFTINDGTTDFAVGDSFTVAVVAGSGKYKLVDKTAVDGSGDRDGNADADIVIVSEDTDATAADQAAPAYQTGVFNPAALTFAAGTVAADFTAILQQQFGIYLKDVAPVHTGV